MFPLKPQGSFDRLRRGVLSTVTLAIALIFSTLATADTYTGNGVPLMASTGAPAAAYPKVDGTVNAVVPDGSGGWYMGGSFTRVGGVARNYLAHILSDGTVDYSWSPNPNAAVYTLAVNGGTLYAGGWFTNIDGQLRNYVAALDSAGNVTSWNPNSNGRVFALAFSGSTVYVGGTFSRIGGQLRNFIAALDYSGNALTSWNPDPRGGAVYALAVNGSTIYAGGAFTTMNGLTLTRKKIAAIDSFGAVTSWNPSANNTIYALALSGDILYAGGSFTSIGGQTRNYLAAIGSSGAATSWNPCANGSVTVLAASGSMVYAGGFFTSIGGQTRNYVAAVNSTGSVTSWNPNANGNVIALAASGGTVYAGGTFTTIGVQSPTVTLSATEGFEVDTGDWVASQAITRVPSGGGVLGLPSSSGGYHAEIQNQQDGYLSLFGDAGFSRYGGSDSVYYGDFYQSIDVYIDVEWMLPVPYPSLEAFWIDMTPYHSDPNNYGAEHNFRVKALGSSVTVTVDGQTTPIATITESGWYTFMMTYLKAANPTEPVITDMNIYDSAGNLVGTARVFATSPGGPFTSSDLRGNGYIWITAWQNGFASDFLAIDNQRTELLPPTKKNQCKKGGWMLLSREDGTTFKNQGGCIQYVNTGK